MGKRRLRATGYTVTFGVTGFSAPERRVGEMNQDAKV